MKTRAPHPNTEGAVRLQWRVPLLAIACLTAATLSASAQSSSTNFVLQQSTLNTSGQEQTSASYRLTASLGQELTVGTSSSTHLVLQSGYWSFLGSGLVPVVLTVEKNVVTPANLDLSWSGNNSPYDVFESTNCASIFASPLTTTPNNTLTNITPPVATLVCYSVLATAPGPAPPPSTP